MSDKTWFPKFISLLFTMICAAVAVYQITGTYSVLNQTYDEPAQIAAGLEWLELGTYAYETQHPPLPRVAVAIGPYLAGVKIKPNLYPDKSYKSIEKMWLSGNEILNFRGEYFRNLTLARLGNLPFFLLTILIVWLWSFKLFGPVVSFISAATFSILPPVLGHAGIATTDMTFTANFMGTLFAFTLWWERCSISRTIFLACFLSLAVLSKFSIFLFLPAAILGFIIAHILMARLSFNAIKNIFSKQCKLRMISLVVICFVCPLLIWSIGYKFSTGTLINPELRPEIEKKIANSLFLQKYSGIMGNKIYTMQLPMPELFTGILSVFRYNEAGYRFPACFMGECHDKGVWYFFIVSLGFKAPLAFLIFSLTGIFFLTKKTFLKNEWKYLAPGIFAIMIFMSSLFANINLGIRHILVVFPLLSISAGYGVYSLWQRTRFTFFNRALVLVLCAWLIIIFFRTAPDYLTYTNILAQANPEKYVGESDLDWGQDLYRLSREVEKRDIKTIYLKYFGTAKPGFFKFPEIKPLEDNKEVAGWVAVSVWSFQHDYQNNLSWLKKYNPLKKIGNTINLYYIPKAEQQ